MSVKDQLDEIRQKTEELQATAAAEKEQVAEALGKLDNIIATQEQIITELKENQVDTGQLEKVSALLSEVKTDIGNIYNPDEKV